MTEPIRFLNLYVFCHFLHKCPNLETDSANRYWSNKEIIKYNLRLNAVAVQVVEFVPKQSLLLEKYHVDIL